MVGHLAARGSVELASAPASGRPGGESASHPEAPATKFSACQKLLQDEDVVFAHERLRPSKYGPTWSLYCVADGHGGREAAAYARERLWKALGPALPADPLPDTNSADFEQFALKIRTALVNTFVRVGGTFIAESCEDKSGAAMTATLLCGRLLTVANVGDADAVVDTGTESFLATVNHSIQSNEAERKRLAAAGAHLAAAAPADATRPVGQEEEGRGPVRCWPGGSTLSRSIGDVEAGDNVLSCPHVFQMALPRSGARLLMGSSGLWSLIGWKKAVQVARRAPISRAASKVVESAIHTNKGALQGDTSAVVVDAMPREDWEFPRLVRQMASERRARGYLCGCACAVGRSRKMGLLRPEGGACDGSQIVAHIDGRLLVSDPGEAVLRDSFSSLAGLICLASDGCDDGCTPRTRTSGRRSAGYSQSERWSCSSRRDSQEACRRAHAPITPVEINSLPERPWGGWVDGFRPGGGTAQIAFYDRLPAAPGRALDAFRVRELPAPVVLAQQLPPTPTRSSESARRCGGPPHQGDRPAPRPESLELAPAACRRKLEASPEGWRAERAPGWGAPHRGSPDTFSFRGARRSGEGSTDGQLRRSTSADRRDYGAAQLRRSSSAERRDPCGGQLRCSTLAERQECGAGGPASWAPVAWEPHKPARPTSATASIESGLCPGRPFCRSNVRCAVRLAESQASAERRTRGEATGPSPARAPSGGPPCARPAAHGRRPPGRKVPFTMRASDGEPGGDLQDDDFNRDGWEVPMHSQAFRHLLLEASALLGKDHAARVQFEGYAPSSDAGTADAVAADQVPAVRQSIEATGLNLVGSGHWIGSA